MKFSLMGGVLNAAYTRKVVPFLLVSVVLSVTACNEDGHSSRVSDLSYGSDLSTSSGSPLSFEPSSDNSLDALISAHTCPSDSDHAFNNYVVAVPDIVEAENFDPAGYQDSSTGNEGGSYRTNTDVDIKGVDSGYALGWITSGEWLEYTINVETEGDYDITIRSGSINAGRKLSITQCGQTLIDSFTIPVVGAWGEFKVWPAGTIHLTPGIQKIRVTATGPDFFDLDWIYIGPYNSTMDPPDPEVEAPTSFPNPLIRYDASDPVNGPGNYIFTADGAGFQWNDKLYLFTTHDEQAQGVSGYRMFDYRLWETTDMIHWENKGAVARYSDWAWARGNDAAGDANAMQTVHRKDAQGNDKFYIYVPINGDPSGWGITIGVGVADRPEGPYTDPRGMPMILLADTAGLWYQATGQTADHGWRNLDPTVFVDDDGRAYMYWGNNSLYWVELEQDMIHLKGESYSLDASGKMINRNTSNVKINVVSNLPDFEEAAYLHKYGDWYYLSFSKGFPESTAYAMSRTPRGPWEYKGHILDSSAIPSGVGTVHHSIFEFKGAHYMSYHNAGLPTGGDYRRSVCIDRIYYNEDGTIKKLIPTTL
ncbi:family 43 glycosylhydrolase [Gynuella sunshinyii]|uniref:Beta-xylosidase n=1 Tax=Gynuella sunshinyii YC6258 TaxID=1445510 RepID=A0A0C5VPF2_9GAMM|nr:family 43 glycosylhydrolase [Gynuella sunshinyii]AJQ96141.1 beta-xylosidase [Gynuella sunshinyii YC6258]